MTDHAKGLLITTLGVLFIVPESLIVRLMSADPLVIAFWRGIVSGTLILAFVLASSGLRGLALVLRSGWPGVIYVLLIGATGPGFVLAVTHTSVANVVFIFAAMPAFAALFGRVFLGERIDRRMVLTMAAVMVGLAIIARGSGESAIASWRGDLYALGVCVAYAGALTAVRCVREISMIPAIPIAYIGASVVIWPLVAPLDPLVAQWPLFLGHGTFIAIATCLLTLGPRYISSAEVSLLILLESVLAPLLVWAVIGEDPGRWALLGGAVVIGALMVSNMVALLQRRST